VFVVVGGVINLIPNTGITAPFVSYGGSSLVANYALVALVLRVSNAARQPASEKKPSPAAGQSAPLAPLAEASTEMVQRDQVRTPPSGVPHQEPAGPAAPGPIPIAQRTCHGPSTLFPAPFPRSRVAPVERASLVRSA